MYLEFNIEKVENIWREIENNFPDAAFSSYSWCESYRHIFSERQYFYVIDETSLIPFEIVKEKGIIILTIQGGKGADFFTPMFDRDRDFGTVLDYIRGKIKFDCFYVPRSKYRYLGMKSVEYFEKSAAAFKTSQTTFEEITKDRVLKDTKRQIKRISEIGKLEFVTIKSIDSNDLFEEFKKMKIDQQKNNEAPSILNEEKYSKVYKIFANTKSNKNVHFSMLKLNDEVISFHLGIKNKNEFVYLLPTYSYKYQNYSPGRIHLFELFKYCDELNVKKFDFSIGAEGYKKYFCNLEEFIYLNYFAYTLKGMLYIQLQILKNKLNSIPKLRAFVLKLKS